MSFQYSKKATNNVFKIIVLYPCYQVVGRHLTELYVITHNYLIDNNLISQNHSSFKHGGSTNFNNFYYRQYFEFTR